MLPAYALLYLQDRGTGSETPRLSAADAQALPLTAVWSVLISLPLLVPGAIGAEPFTVQDGVVVWFFTPFFLTLFHELASSLFSRLSFKGFQNPVQLAYGIVGVVSAIVHVGVAAYAFYSLEPNVSWSRIYWPNHSAVQRGPTFMTEGAMLFMQYDHVVIYLTVFGLAIYLLGYDKLLLADSPAERLKAGRRLLILGSTTLILGPGAGLAYLLCAKESDEDAAEAKAKQS